MMKLRDCISFLVSRMQFCGYVLATFRTVDADKNNILIETLLDGERGLKPMKEIVSRARTHH